MKRILVMVSLLALGACGKKGSDAKWPDKPANGAPIAFEFMELSKDRHGEVAGKFHIFDFDSRGVRMYAGTIHYLAADGKELGNFPVSYSAGGGIVDGKAVGEVTEGWKVPEGTVKMTLDTRRVQFNDGSMWDAPEKG